MVNEIDPYTWYSNREVNFTPQHFTIATTRLTEESKLWVIGTLKGRFSIMNKISPDDLWAGLVESDGVPAFEDPREAMMYELKWS